MIHVENVLVRRNYILLKDELCVHWLHDHLYQNEVLSERDLEELCLGCRPRHMQVDGLLKHLLRHGKDMCSKFLQILPVCGYKDLHNLLMKTTDFKCKEGKIKIQEDLRTQI